MCQDLSKSLEMCFSIIHFYNTFSSLVYSANEKHESTLSIHKVWNWILEHSWPFHTLFMYTFFNRLFDFCMDKIVVGKNRKIEAGEIAQQ